MPFTLRSASPAKTRAEAVVVGVLQGGSPALAAGADDVADAYGRRLRGLLATLGVTGAAGEVVRVPTGGAIPSPLLVLVGLGTQASPEAVRRAAGAAARAVPNATSVALALPADSPDLVAATIEGYHLGGYAFTAYKSGADRPAKPSDVVLLTPLARKPAAIAAAERAEVVAEGVATVRDWVNTPPNDLTPPLFADAVAQAAGSVPGLEVVVHDESELERLGCGGLLSVGAGSAAPPRLVELTYAPEDAVAHVAFVGKGITYDSGGLWIKPSASMAWMKSDMHGAATVAQATIAIARLGLPVRVSAHLAMAENMIGGAAARPGDVATIYGGTTVEITNTDAEGRLVMADAFGRAVEAGPETIVDVATLTGHMVTALGDRIAGVMGDDTVVAAVLAAAERAGEAMWPMPIPAVMSERIRSSKVADLAQYDGIRWGGGLFAAAFLREFTGGIPWAHLDIAGPSWNAGGPVGHVTSGGTGVAVATLVEYADGLTRR